MFTGNVNGGAVSRAVGPATPIPGRGGAMFTSTFEPIAGDGGASFTFIQAISTVRGLYRYSFAGSGVIDTLVDDLTPVPGATPGTTFKRFDNHDYDGRFALFAGDGLTTAAQLQTLWRRDLVSGALKRIAGVGDTPIGALSPITDFEAACLWGDSVVFSAGHFTTGFGGHDGVYLAAADGTVTSILTMGDTLSGRQVRFPTLQDVAGDRALIRVQFTDGTSGMYSTLLPEPTAVAGLLVLGALIASRRRGR